jgi:hypothetical protein
MKYLILFSILFITALAASSQSKFVMKYGSIREEMPFCIKQIGNKYFTAITKQNEPYSYWEETTLMCININGSICKELNFTCPDSNYYFISSLIPIDNTQFLAIGGCKSSELPVSQFWIVKLDTALNILWEKKYRTNQPINGATKVTQNTSGNYLIGTTLTTDHQPWESSLMFLEINENGDSLQSIYLTNGNPYNTSLWDLIWINGQYKAFVYGYGSFISSYYSTQILQLDTSLNLTEIRPGPYDIQTGMSSMKINDSAYYLAGKVHFNVNHFDVSIAKLSNDEDSLAFNHVGGPNNTADYSGWMKCMSFINNNNIYTGGYTEGFGSFYCDNTNRVLMLSNFDSLLNCRWTRFYGSDACYTFNTMDATTDGGCIIAGMYCDPASPANQLDMIVIKVDSSGLFTTDPENQVVTSHEALVYPNPGLNVVSIQSGPQISGAEFSMYGASGNQVLKTALVSTIEQMDVSHLASGIYFWQIIYNRKVIEKGNWIKQ